MLIVLLYFARHFSFSLNFAEIQIQFLNYNFVYLSLYRILVGRPEGKRPLGRPRRMWDYNIKKDLRG
jgi:hypothetical protein